MSMRGWLLRVVPLVAVVGVAGVVPLAQAAAGGSVGGGGSGAGSGAGGGLAGASLDWPQFLHDPQHDSVSAAAAFTPANAGSAARVWRWRPPSVRGEPAPELDASPVVVAGVVYIGAQSGGFYALKESTGGVVWSRQLDTQPNGVCTRRGITATAAVVADPVTGTPTVYVSGARYLYALNAGTGAVVWQTRIGPRDAANPDAYYNWSSPTVSHGHVYVGLASSCDNNTLIRGGVVELDQHTGVVQHKWYSVPAGSIGASVWSTVAVSATGGDVWVSTGNECDPTVNTCPRGNQIGNALSIVHLSGSLQFRQAWQVPKAAGHGHDWDFGASPTLFGGTGVPPDVGACNKDGDFYALAASPLGSSPLWTLKVGIPTAPPARTGECLAAAVWDGTTGALYIGGNTTTIRGRTYQGSIGQVNPATGHYIWQTGLPCAVEGSPSLDSAGVLAAGTYSCPKSAAPDAYLLNAATGKVLDSLPVGTSHVFGQPVFAQGTLFIATEDHGLYDFAP